MLGLLSHNEVSESELKRQRVLSKIQDLDNSFKQEALALQELNNHNSLEADFDRRWALAGDSEERMLEEEAGGGLAIDQYKNLDLNKHANTIIYWWRYLKSHESQRYKIFKNRKFFLFSLQFLSQFCLIF